MSGGVFGMGAGEERGLLGLSAGCQGGRWPPWGMKWGDLSRSESWQAPRLAPVPFPLFFYSASSTGLPRRVAGFGSGPSHGLHHGLLPFPLVL